MAVPLVPQGHTLGVLTLVQAEPARGSDDPQLELVQDMAHRAAVAVNNAVQHAGVGR